MCTPSFLFCICGDPFNYTTWKVDGATPVSLGLSWPLTKNPPIFRSGDRHRSFHHSCFSWVKIPILGNHDISITVKLQRLGGVRFPRLEGPGNGITKPWRPMYIMENQLNLQLLQLRISFSMQQKRRVSPYLSTNQSHTIHLCTISCTNPILSTSLVQKSEWIVET